MNEQIERYLGVILQYPGDKEMIRVCLSNLYEAGKIAALEAYLAERRAENAALSATNHELMNKNLLN